MKLMNIGMLRTFSVIIFLSFVGCNSWILIESEENSIVQDFYLDNYKMQVRITLIPNENEYLCTFSLFNKNDLLPLEGIKSYLDIKSYGPFRRRYKRRKYSYMTDLEPIYNGATKEYECKYKFTSKGKYEITIRLSEISGKVLEENLLISFNQEVK